MNEPLRVVHVGCGSMAAVWLAAAVREPRIRIVGLVDVQGAAAEARRAEYVPDAGCFVDLNRALAEVKPDVVFNCTVPEAHESVSISALAAGAHVLTEKPLARSLHSANAIVAAAAREGRLLAVSQNYRYRAAPRTVREVLATGLLGEVHTVTCDYWDALHFEGFRTTMRHPLLVEMSIHHFDLARFFGYEFRGLTSVQEWNPPGSWFTGGGSLCASFGTPPGCVFLYRASWCAEGQATSGNGSWRFVGSRGSLEWDGADRIVAQTVRRTGGFKSELEDHRWPVQPAPGRDASHASVITEFVDCVRHGGVPETNGADNLRSLAMVCDCLQVLDLASAEKIAAAPNF